MRERDTNQQNGGPTGRLVKTSHNTTVCILPEWVSSKWVSSLVCAGIYALVCAGLPFCTTMQAHGRVSFHRHMFFDGFSLGRLFQLSMVFFLLITLMLDILSLSLS
jgi:hypothetical protein